MNNCIGNILKSMKKRNFIVVGIVFGIILMLFTGGLGTTNANAIKFKKNRIELAVGKSIQNPLCYTKKGKKIVYRSANKKIATVSKKGKITGKKAGKTRITATYQKKKYTCVVRVVTVKRTQKIASTLSPTVTPETAIEPEKTAAKEMKVTYIDVGQADSTLIQADGYNILVDCGNDKDSDLDAITETLNENGVKELDAVILTHWHEDHIGCFRYLPARYTIKSVYIRENINNISTNIYEYTKEAIEANKIDVYYPKAGDVKEFGAMQFRFIGPVAAEYHDENANSIVFVLKFGENTFFFGGDTTQEGESDILKQYTEELTGVDCYKVNHHGSTYSNSYAFIRQLTERPGTTLDKRPFCAIISCGLNNEYFHPHEAVLERLEQAQAKTYRTDMMGTICVISDSKTLTVSTENKNAQVSNEPAATTETPTPTTVGDIYIGNKNSFIVHKSTCNNLPAEKNRVYFEDIDTALENGYKKCSNCFKE